MRHFIFFLFSISFSPQILAQDSTIIVIGCGEDDIYEVPEIDPMFPGGEDSLMTFIAKNFVMPSTCACCTWIIYVSFDVNTDGSLSEIKILQGSNNVLDDEALRVVSLMPNWIPALHEGKVVRSRYVIPIRVDIR